MGTTFRYIFSRRGTVLDGQYWYHLTAHRLNSNNKGSIFSCGQNFVVNGIWKSEPTTLPLCKQSPFKGDTACGRMLVSISLRYVAMNSYAYVRVRMCKNYVFLHIYFMSTCMMCVTCMYACEYACVCMCMHTCVYTCLRFRMHGMCTGMHATTHASVCVHMCTCIYARVRLCTNAFFDWERLCYASHFLRVTSLRISIAPPCNVCHIKAS